MGRPPLHDRERILDAAESLAVSGGGGLSMRSLAAVTGASTGSLYHSFGSKADLLARVWLRGARRFLRLQAEAIAAAGQGPGSHRRRAVEATIAAALTVTELRARYPRTARFIAGSSREQLLRDGVSPESAKALRGTDHELTELLTGLSMSLWGRDDRAAVETVAACVVDIPTSFLLGRRRRIIDPSALVRYSIEGVLAHGPLERASAP
jgi:AcrR family transcriptional regulator